MSEIDWKKFNEYNQQVIAEFRANGGQVGGQFAGAPMVLITTTGAKTGQERISPLVYGKTDSGELFIIASKGGAPKDPHWFVNLQKNPEIGVEVGTEKYQAHARITSNPEREKLYDRMVAAMPNFQEYREKANREIPVVVLEKK